MLEYTSSFATSPTGSGHGDIVTYGQDSLPTSNGRVNGVVYYLKPNGEWALAVLLEQKIQQLDLWQ